MPYEKQRRRLWRYGVGEYEEVKKQKTQEGKRMGKHSLVKIQCEEIKTRKCEYKGHKNINICLSFPLRNIFKH